MLIAQDAVIGIGTLSSNVWHGRANGSLVWVISSCKASWRKYAHSFEAHAVHFELNLIEFNWLEGQHTVKQ